MECHGLPALGLLAQCAYPLRITFVEALASRSAGFVHLGGWECQYLGEVQVSAASPSSSLYPSRQLNSTISPVRSRGCCWLSVLGFSSFIMDI